MTTTTARSHCASAGTAGGPRPVEPRGATSVRPQSAAFLLEVRRQWALTTSLHDDAAARGDDLDRQDALERLEELRELLWHHDLSLDALDLGGPGSAPLG